MLALLVARFAGRPEVVAFAFLGVLGVALVAIDVAVQHLRNCAALDCFRDYARDCPNAAATAWLQENVQQHGGLYKPTDLIAKATGAEPSEAPLMDYLEAKFGEIYDL